MEVVRDTLCQSGIEGMKWGVRNGPPYPLRPSDHSSAEIKANPSLRKKIASGVSKSVSVAKAVHERRRLNTKNPKRLTDSELKSRIQRLRDEEEFRKLQGIKTKQQAREKKLAAGKAFAVAFMTKLGGRVGSIGTTVNQKIAQKVLKEKKPLLLFGAEAAEKKRLKYSKKLEANKAKSEFKKYTNEEKAQHDREKAQRKEEKKVKKYSDVDKVIKSWEASNELTRITNSINDIISDVKDVKYEDLVR